MTSKSHFPGRREHVHVRNRGRFLVGAAVLAPSIALAQPPGPPEDGPRPPRGDRERPRDERPAPPPILVTLDANRDGELSAKEIRNASDALSKLDHNHDGILDRSELFSRPRPGGPPRGPEGRPRPEGPPRRERDGGFRPEGPPRGERDGGFRPEGPPRGERDGGFRPDGPPEGRRPPRDGAGPHIGHVLPPFAREELALTEAQEDKIAALEKDVATKLEAILTPDQLHELRMGLQRGPGGRGPGGPGGRGPGGPGRPGGRGFGGPPGTPERPPVRPERP